MNFKLSSILLLMLVALVLQSSAASPENRRFVKRNLNNGKNGQAMGRFWNKNRVGYGGNGGVNALDLVLHNNHGSLYTTVTGDSLESTSPDDISTSSIYLPGTSSLTSSDPILPPCASYFRSGDNAKPEKEVNNDVADEEDNNNADIKNDADDTEDDSQKTDVMNNSQVGDNEVDSKVVEPKKEEDLSKTEEARSLALHRQHLKHRRNIQLAKRRNQLLRRKNQKLKIQLKKSDKIRSRKAKLQRRRRQQLRRQKRKAMLRQRKRMMKLRRKRLLQKKRKGGKNKRRRFV